MMLCVGMYIMYDGRKIKSGYWFFKLYSNEGVGEIEVFRFGRCLDGVVL